MSLGYLSVSAFVVRARHSGPLGGVHNAQQSSRSRRVLRHITLMASHEKNTGDSNGNSEDRDASTRQPDDVNSQQGDASSGPKMGRRSIAIPLAARDPAR